MEMEAGPPGVAAAEGVGLFVQAVAAGLAAT